MGLLLLQLNADDSVDEFVCYDCWFKVKSFHEFYQSIEKLHDRHESEIMVIETFESNSTEKPITDNSDNLINNLHEIDAENDNYFEVETLDETSSTSDDMPKIEESIKHTEELIGLQIDFMNQKCANESSSNADVESLDDDELGLKSESNDNCSGIGHSLDVNKKIEILDNFVGPSCQKKGRPIKDEPKIDKIE